MRIDARALFLSIVFRRPDARLQSILFARWNHFPGAPRFDATGAILTRLFGGLRRMSRITSVERNLKNENLYCL